MYWISIVIVMMHHLFSGTTRMELLFDHVTLQIYLLHTIGHFQVIWAHLPFVTTFKDLRLWMKQEHQQWLLLLFPDLPCGSSGQIHAAVWPTPLEMSCPSFTILRRNMVAHTLCFTRERTARWVERQNVPRTLSQRSPTLTYVLTCVFLCVSLNFEGIERCQTGASLLTGVPSRWWPPRHGWVLPVL